MAEIEEDQETRYRVSREYATMLVNCLSTGDTEKAQLLFRDNCNKFVKGDIWFFLSAVKKFITLKTLKEKPQIFDCVRGILVDLAETAHPDMTIMEFIELGEITRDYVVLLVVLEPYKIILDKMRPKWSHSLMWCLVVIEKHIRKLPSPIKYNIQGQELPIVDGNPDVARIVRVYKLVEPFYEYFVSKVMVGTDVSAMNDRRFLIRSIIIILGHPLVYNVLQSDGQSKNDLRVISENFVRNLSRVSNDLLQYLAYTDEINKPKVERVIPPNRTDDAYEESAEESSENLFDVEDHIPVLGLGVLYYLIIGEKEFEDLLPCVYSPLYIFHKGLRLSSELLKHAELEVVYKGLILAEAVVVKVSKASVSSSQVETETHQQFLDKLHIVMVNCPEERLRRLAIRILHEYLSVLNRKCQYLLFVHLLNTTSDLGIIAFLITYVKDIVSTEMKDGGPISPYFKGRMLHILIKMFFVLPEGEKTDLVKHMGPICAMLNFIRFMILRDKCDETGFLGCLSELKRVFLVPLENGIKVSKHDLKLELESEIGKNQRKVKRDNDDETVIALTISGKTVKKDRLGTLESSLTHLDLMESLLCRVRECLDSGQN